MKRRIRTLKYALANPAVNYTAPKNPYVLDILANEATEYYGVAVDIDAVVVF